MIRIEEITEYTSENHEAIQRFTKVFQQEVNHLTPEYFKEIITSTNSHLFILCENENIAGMLTIGIYKSPTGSKAWIEDVVIDEIHRGKGFGKLIMQHAVEFVKLSQIDLLMLTSNPARIAANKLYQSLGFDQKNTNVYKMTF
ncbi:MAG: GNAT family N-acetyltransferase [Dysgonomonas sp.]